MRTELPRLSPMPNRVRTNRMSRARQLRSTGLELFLRIPRSSRLLPSRQTTRQSQFRAPGDSRLACRHGARAPVLHRTSGPGFTPRRFDPRAGYFPDAYRDYSAALGEPLDQQFIIRHRLQKRDPACVRDCEAQALFSTMWIVAHPNCPYRPGGRRTLWDQAFQAAVGRRAPSASNCCLPTQTRWIFATTSFSGCIIHARLELWQCGRRSPHWRNHQGKRHLGSLRARQTI